MKPYIRTQRLSYRRKPSRWPYLGVAFLLFVSCYYVMIGRGTSTAQDSKSTTSKEYASVQAVQEKQETLRVGIQAGHWNASELPDELSNLRWNFGTSQGDANEWEISLEIAQAVGDILGNKGIKVDILPATIPKGYKADAFISIHADGNEDPTVSGFKVAFSEWDHTGEAQNLADRISAEYKKATSLPEDPNITPDMTEYYAFNHGKFSHAIDRDTPGIIIELGFITNTRDRRIILNSTDNIAESISKGILDHFEVQ